MKAWIQRVREASVTIEGEKVAEIGQGYLVLLGVTHGDTEAAADKTPVDDLPVKDRPFYQWNVPYCKDVNLGKLDETLADFDAKIAAANKPITFHTGILWDGCASSENFRPSNWEPLLAIPRLRFALCHISWPWCEECVAVYGKLLNAITRNGERNVPEMFIDTTPGAHGIWRRDALMHIYQTHFRKGMLGRLMFGIDNSVHDYVVSYSRKYQDFDDALFREWNVTGEEIDSYYRGALQNFLFG